MHARIQERGWGPGPPPLRFLSYFYYYFLARSARQYYIYIYNKDGKYNSEKYRLKSMRPTKYANMYFAYEVAPKHFFFNSGMRGSSGVGGPYPPPHPSLRFVRGRVLCGYLMGMRRGPKVVFILFLFFLWLAPLANIPNIVHVNI